MTINKRIIFVVVVILLVGCFFCGQSLWMSWKTKGYQAVFLDDGQVYFGKLSGGRGWLALSDIYYLQGTEPLQQTESGKTINSAQNIQLIKLGNELHGPADTMYIKGDKVLFWENMKEDS